MSRIKDMRPDPDAEVAHLRVPPHSIEAEQSVLGGLLLDNAGFDQVGDILHVTDFYRLEHRLIFGAISDLVIACKPADVVTTYQHLQESDSGEECGGMPYLNALAQCVPSAANVRRYAEIVRSKALLRKLVAASDEIATAAFNPQGRDASLILDQAEQTIGALRGNRNAGEDWESTEEGMVRALDRINAISMGESKPDFIPTGLAELDERMDGGMRAGDLIVIGARPSMGKTAMALTIARNLAVDQNLPVAIFSMEMPRAQINNRLLSIESRIHLSRLKRPERLRDYDWGALSEAVEKLGRAPIHINDQSNLDIIQLRAKARALRRKVGKLGLIVVDYLSLMAGVDPRANRAQQLAEVSMGLKALAKELECPVAALQQVKRESESRGDPMPILSDLKDSGSIEQDADIVIFVHRPIKQDPLLSDEWKYYADVSVAKLRDGEPGKLDLMYVGENTRFMNWPKDTPVPTSKTRVQRSKKGADL